LDVTEGPATGERVAVPPTGLRLGRSGILAGDDTVSLQHADVTPTSSGFEIRDLGSTNGTFVNGTRITRRALLKAGDTIQLGETVLTVRLQDVVPFVSGRPHEPAPVQLGGGQQASSGGVIGGQFHGPVTTQTTTYEDSSGLTALMQARGLALALMIVGAVLALAGFASFAYPIIRFIAEGAQTFGSSTQPTLQAVPWLPLGAILFFAGAVCMTAGIFAGSGRRD
jgi:FHA domain